MRFYIVLAVLVIVAVLLALVLGVMPNPVRDYGQLGAWWGGPKVG